MAMIVNNYFVNNIFLVCTKEPVVSLLTYNPLGRFDAFHVTEYVPAGFS